MQYKQYPNVDFQLALTTDKVVFVRNRGEQNHTASPAPADGTRS